MENMLMDVQDIRNRVAEQRNVIDSAKTLLTSLHQRLDDAIKAEDPAALQALADDIQANTTSLAAAVQENTPAVVSPPSAPTPTPADPAQPTT
jgi:DNA-binding FadR family transcriptional regulator